LLRQLEASGNVLALTLDGSFLAGGNDQGEVAVWRISDGRLLPKIPAGHNPILSLAFCRDFVRDPFRPPEEPQWLLAIGDSGGGVSIWEVPAQTVRTRCRGAQYDRSALTFSPDGTVVASAGRFPIALWDTATGHPMVTIAMDYLTDIAISDDGKRFAATCWQRGGPAYASVLVLENGRGIHTLRGLSHQVTKVCFSSDAHLVAAVADDW
jgi:WD40 repeat protein